MRLVEFYERRAFGHHTKHFINPEEVTSLSATNYGEETIVNLRGGTRVLVSAGIETVRAKLESDLPS